MVNCSGRRASSAREKVVGVGFQNFPVDADGGVVAFVSLSQNRAALLVGEVGTNFFHVVDVPNESDLVGGFFLGLAHGVVSLADGLRPCSRCASPAPTLRETGKPFTAA